MNTSNFETKKRRLPAFFAVLRKPLTVIFLLAVGAVSVFFVLEEFGGKEFSVVKTSRGFIPSKIVVDSGDTVVFTSEEGKDYWPASDSHPTHGLYPGFDPKRPVTPEETWSFTFDTPGIWGFHDHLDSRFTGQIIVRGEPGEGREECLKQRKETELAPICWEADVTDTLSKDGLSAAFALVDSFYAEDPAFRRNCHDVMHILGAAAFREFKSDPEVSAEKRTSYCGYGFYHGFIETMLVENGNSNFDAVKKYCAQLRTAISPSAAGPCFHGIGHAIFDSLPGTVWGSSTAMSESALAVCESVLTEDEELAQCASGVYNSLANALSARNYEITFSDFDPVSYCEKQKTLYQKNCYGEIGTGYIREKHMEREAALSFVRGLKESVRYSQFFNYFGDETKRSMFDLNVEALSASCAELTDTRENRSCIDGVLQGFREATQVEKTYEVTLPFCGGLADATQNEYCIEKAVTSTSAVIRNTPAFHNACVRYAGSEATNWCGNI